MPPTGWLLRRRQDHLRQAPRRAPRLPLWRAVTREELWNGNRERVSEWLAPDHPIRWAWSRFDGKRRDEKRMVAPEYAHLRFHRLRDRRAVEAYLARA